MGTWDFSIKGNDTFFDVYEAFFSRYNNGEDPKEVSALILNEFADVLNDYEDKYNSLFAIALAQWETKVLTDDIYEKVKSVIEKGDDIRLWEELGADEKMLKARKKELEKFLKRISSDKKSAKKGIRVKDNYQSQTLLELPAPEGNRILSVVKGYMNEVYLRTSAMLHWNMGGSGIFTYVDEGEMIAARWIDNQTLEISHDKSINFFQKEEKFYFMGDEGIIIYTEQ